MTDRLRIIFTVGRKSLVSWLIRRFGRDTVSHVGIMDGGMVISAEDNGVVEQSLDDFLKGRRTVYIFEATEEGQKHIDLVHARTMLGTKYGYKTLPGFAVGYAFDTDNPWGDRAASLVCSEFVLYADDETGFITEWANLNKETTSPQLLAKAMLRGGSTFRLIYPGRKTKVE